MTKLSKKVQKIFEDIATKTIMTGTSVMIYNLDTLQQCQFVVTGCIQGSTNIMWRIGYVVQVRMENNCFNTSVFIRHADGRLRMHSNQSYYKVNDVNTITLMKYFDVLPEYDLQNKEGYTNRGKDLQSDFIVRKNNSV